MLYVSLFTNFDCAILNVADWQTNNVGEGLWATIFSGAGNKWIQ